MQRPPQPPISPGRSRKTAGCAARSRDGVVAAPEANRPLPPTSPATVDAATERAVWTGFPWVSSRTLRFTAQGEFSLSFPPACPLVMHFLQFTGEHRLTPSFHEYPEFSLICEGTGRFIVENRSYPLVAGDFLLVGSREFHRLEADSGRVLKAASVHFLPELVHAPGESTLSFEYLKPFYYRGARFTHRIPRGELPEHFVGERIGAMHREIQVGSPDYPLAVKTWLADILFEVSRYYRRTLGELTPHDQRVRDFERLLEVFSYVRKNCHEPLSLRQVARMAHMSPNYFCRFFKATTGNTLTEYLLRLRIDLAMDFLSNSAMSVTDIAYAAGFSSHSYFDRVFKRLKGVTPLEYRRQLKV